METGDVFQWWWIVYQLNTFHTATQRWNNRVWSDGKSWRDMETEGKWDCGGQLHWKYFYHHPFCSQNLLAELIWTRCVRLLTSCSTLWLCAALTHLATAKRFNPIREVPIRKHPPENRQNIPCGEWVTYMHIIWCIKIIINHLDLSRKHLQFTVGHGRWTEQPRNPAAPAHVHGSSSVLLPGNKS